MLQGDGEAEVSNRANGVTFSNACYRKTISGMQFRIYDTVGLNEGTEGTVAARDAIIGMYELILQLDDGVNLLVYVMRAPRISRAAKQNYDIFFEAFCDRKVPIVIVVTGLGGEDNKDGWFEENKPYFDQYKMFFSGSASITATKGKLRDGVYSYGAEYEASKKTVEALIWDSWTEEPWRMPRIPWFTSAAVRLRNIFVTALGMEPTLFAVELYHALQQYAGLSDSEARANAYEVEKKLSFRKWARPKRFSRLRR